MCWKLCIQTQQFGKEPCVCVHLLLALCTANHHNWRKFHDTRSASPKSSDIKRSRVLLFIFNKLTSPQSSITLGMLMLHLKYCSMKYVLFCSIPIGRQHSVLWYMWIFLISLFRIVKKSEKKYVFLGTLALQGIALPYDFLQEISIGIRIIFEIRMNKLNRVLAKMQMRPGAVQNFFASVEHQAKWVYEFYDFVFS